MFALKDLKQVLFPQKQITDLSLLNKCIDEKYVNIVQIY